MAVHCNQCGGAHPTWDCSAPEAKKRAWRLGQISTAAMKESPGKTTVRDALAQIGTTPPVKAAEPPVSKEAAFASTGDSIRKRVPKVNRQVGIKPNPSMLDVEPIAVVKQSDDGSLVEHTAVQEKRKPGRPKGPVPFDRKAYSKAYMKDWRARQKDPAASNTGDSAPEAAAVTAGEVNPLGNPVDLSGTNSKDKA